MGTLTHHASAHTAKQSAGTRAVAGATTTAIAAIIATFVALASIILASIVLASIALASIVHASVTLAFTVIRVDVVGTRFAFAVVPELIEAHLSIRVKGVCVRKMRPVAEQVLSTIVWCYEAKALFLKPFFHDACF